jgi:hypothetical protein
MRSRPSEIWSRDFLPRRPALRSCGAFLTQRGRFLLWMALAISGLIVGVAWSDLN